MKATPLRRVNNASHEFNLPDESELDFFMTYTYHEEGERHIVRQIRPKMKEMIDNATKSIIISVFLLDCLYSNDEEIIEEDLAGFIVNSLVEKKKKQPDIQIGVILDPINRAYARRVSPAEKLFRENHIDVFYSDMLQGLKTASPLGLREGFGWINRGIDKMSFNQWSRFWSFVCGGVLQFPGVKWDDHPASLQTAWDALYLKANHRKLLVADTPDGDMEAMVTSSNPHNASSFDVNTAVTVKGKAAAYVYNMLRLDMMHSAKLGSDYAHWHYGVSKKYKKKFGKKRFAPIDMVAASSDKDDKRAGGGDSGGSGQEQAAVAQPRVRIVTESKIREAVLEMLDSVEEGDSVRVQLLYLSCPAVLDAIVRASERTSQSVRVLLEPYPQKPFEKTDREIDGTPNQQAARYLREKSLNKVEIRWYATHGEKNHPKIMSITNERRGTKPKHLLTTGSCNFTGRNLNGVNMESNIVVTGSPKVSNKYDQLFDMMWENTDGKLYSEDFSVFEHRKAPNWKWRIGERPFYWNTF